MGARRPRSTRKRKPVRPGRRRARSRRRLNRFLFILLFSVVLAASLWLAYTLWVERGAKDAHPPGAAPGLLPAERIEVTLYFSDEQAEQLTGERRNVRKLETPSRQWRELLQELGRGSTTGLQATLPPGAKVRDVIMGPAGLCTVDFSEELVRNHPGGSSGELMTVYSIVQTIAANIPGVRSVQILVEGRPRETLAGHLSIGTPIQPDPRLLRN